MQKTILSIDLGSAWVKLLQTQVGLRSEAILNFKLLRVYPEDTPVSIADKIYNAIEQYNLFADQNLLAVNGKKALYQELSFPFTQQNKIKQVLPLELEANIPVNLSGYIWDYFLTNTGPKQCKAFCVLQDKDSIRQWLDAFQESGITINRIDLDLTAYSGFASFVSGKSENHAFLDLGWSKINLAIIQNSQIRLMRNIPLGIRDIVQEMDPDTDGEETQKLEDIFAKLAKEKDNSHNSLPGSYLELVRQIKLSFMQENSLPDNINTHITGGGASLPSLSEILSRDTGLELSREELPVPDSLRLREPSSTALLFTALGLHRTHQKSGLNFRQGELALEEYEPLWKPHLRYGIVALALILCTWGFSFGSDIYLQQKKLDKLQTQIKQTFYEIAPGASKNLNPMQYSSIIRSRIDALKSGTVSEKVPPAKSTRLLSSISKALPEDLQLQIELFSLDRSSLNLSGNAKDYNTVNRIKKHLKGLNYLSNVEIVGANVNQGGEKVSFNIRATIQEQS
uniref:Type IV pilus assembly protein PilM n=1 Tax=uncultured organism TaxID=155900 RepID=M1P2M6_9ZZZZ|nr:type IV pilus assembly protein PilM [uncultured organism]